MKCELIALSKPSAQTDCNTAEELVAYCARVSNPENQANHGSAGKLIQYLIRNNHWSPLEMVHLTIGIETTRDIARQILRHRSFSFQEFSQRYARVAEFELRDARMQDLKNRQNSIFTENQALKEEFRMRQQGLLCDVQDNYEWALDSGIAKEQARVFLPEGLTVSKMYMAGTLRSWIHYCQLRMANGTQLEHMDVAKQCWEIIGQNFPNIVEVFKPNPLHQMIDDFCEKLKKRVDKKGEDGKYGWEQDDWQDSLLEQLNRNWEEGDPLDVAAFCAMADYHGWKINGE